MQRAAAAGLAEPKTPGSAARIIQNKVWLRAAGRQLRGCLALWKEAPPGEKGGCRNPAGLKRRGLSLYAPHLLIPPLACFLGFEAREPLSRDGPK